MIRYTVLLNSSVNFIIYCVAGVRFRAVLVELLGNVSKNSVKYSHILMDINLPALSQLLTLVTLIPITPLAAVLMNLAYNSSHKTNHQKALKIFLCQESNALVLRPLNFIDTIHRKLRIFVPILTAKQCSNLWSQALFGVEQLCHSFPPVNQGESCLLNLQGGSLVLATYNPLNLQPLVI